MLQAVRSSLKITLIASGALSLMHCGTTADNVQIKDNNAPSYSLAVVRKTAPDSRWALAADIQSTKGEGVQDFPEAFTYGSGGMQQGTLRPATSTQNDFTLTATSVAARWTLLDKKHLTMNIYFGGTLVDASVDIREANGKQWHLARDAFRFAPKFELGYPLNDKLSLSASITNLIDSHIDYTSMQIAMNLKLTEAMAFNLGYKRWSFDDNPGSVSDVDYPAGTLAFDHTSELELDSKGLLAGLTFSF